MDIKTGFTVGSPAMGAGNPPSGEAPSVTGSLSDSGLVRGLAMAPYDSSVGFAGPQLSFSLSPVSDALPNGLSLSGTGILSGTPAEVVTSRNIIVRATNADGFVESGFQIDVVEPVFSAVINGATINPTYGTTAQDQVVLTAAASDYTGATPASLQYQWKTVESGDIAGATGATYAPSAGVYDLETLFCTITPDDYAPADTQTLVIRHAPPSAAGGIVDEIFDEGTGDQTIATAFDFAGQDIGYGVTGPAGTSVDGATGIVTVSTDVAFAGALVEVTGTNSGGSAVSNFLVTVEAVASGASEVFGALTRSGAGGIDVSGTAISTGDPGGHWQISSGLLSPSAAGEDALSGVYQLEFDDGSDLQVTVLADQYSVRCEKAEIESAHAHALANRAALDSICSVRAGFTSDEIDLSNSAFTGSFTLRGEGFDTNGALRPNGYSWSAQVGNVLMAGSNIHLEQLEIYAPRSTVVAAAVYQPTNTTITDFSIRQCHLFGDNLGEWVEAMLVANDPLTNTLVNGINFNEGGARGLVEDNYLHDFLGGSSSNVDDYTIQGNYSENFIGGWIGTLNSGPTGIKILNNEHYGMWGALSDPGDIHGGLGGGSVIGRGTPQSETNVKGVAKGNVALVGNARQEWEESQGRALVTPIDMAGTTGFKLNDPTSGLNGYSGWEIAHNILQLTSPVGMNVENGENIYIHHNTLVGVRGTNDDPTIEDGSPAFNLGKDGNYTFSGIGIWANITGPSHGMNQVLDDVLAGFDLFENEAVMNTVASPVGAVAAHSYAEYFEGDPVKQYGANLTPAEAIGAFTPRFWTRAAQRNLGAVNGYYPIGIPGKGAVDTTPAFVVPDSSGSPAASGHVYEPTLWDGSYGLQLAQGGVNGAMLDGGSAVADGKAFTVIFQGSFTGPDSSQMVLIHSNSQDFYVTRGGDGVTARNRLTFDLDQASDNTTGAFYYSPIDQMTAARGRVCCIVSVDQANDRICYAVNGVVRELHNYNQYSMGDVLTRLGTPDVHLFETNLGGSRFMGEVEALIIENQFIDLHSNLGALAARDGFLRDPAALTSAFGRQPLVFVSGDAAAINAGSGNANGRSQAVEVTNGGTVSDATSDTTAPVLSAPSGAASGATTASGSVTTDEANGSLYWVVSTSATAPSAAQVIAGNDASGSAGVTSGAQTVTVTGVQNVSLTGLSPDTQYFTHFTQEDDAGNRAAVASASGFTTDAASASGFAVDEGSSDGTFSTSGGFRVWEGANGDQLVVTGAGTPTGLELVGGGGGGGHRAGGGAGAGELVQITSGVPAFTAQTYTANVGAGGQAGVSADTSNTPTSGGNTRIVGGTSDDVSLTAFGGGYGGSDGNARNGTYGLAAAGGSGGGSGPTNVAGRYGASTASDGVGATGGNGSYSNLAGGGGGGAAGPGNAQAAGVGGTGGGGLVSLAPGKGDVLASGGDGGNQTGTGGNGADAVSFGGGGAGGHSTFGERNGGAGAPGTVRVWWPV